MSDETNLVPVKNTEVIESGIPVGALALNGHLFAPIVLTAKGGKPKIVKLSQREAKFTHKLLNTGNIEIACDEIGISIGTGRRWLKRGSVKVFIEEQLEQLAFSRGTTVDNNLCWLRKVRDGHTTADRSQLDAAKVIAKVLRPAGGNTAVQVNNYGPGASMVANPYTSLSNDQLLADTEERVQFLKGRGASPA